MGEEVNDDMHIHLTGIVSAQKIVITLRLESILGWHQVTPRRCVDLMQDDFLFGCGKKRKIMRKYGANTLLLGLWLEMNK